MLASINHEQGLYVLHAGNGITCLGFNVALEWATGVAKWLNQHGEQSEMPNAELCGTTEGFHEYRRLMDKGADFHRRTGKRCNIQLTKQLVGLEGKRVEIMDRIGQKRRFWVGKSTGWMPIHLEVARTNSIGGHSVYGTPFQSVRIRLSFMRTIPFSWRTLAS